MIKNQWSQYNFGSLKEIIMIETRNFYLFVQSRGKKIKKILSLFFTGKNIIWYFISENVIFLWFTARKFTKSKRRGWKAEGDFKQVPGKHYIIHAVDAKCMFSAMGIEEHSFLFNIWIIIRNATLHSTQIYKMYKSIMLKMKI